MGVGAHPGRSELHREERSHKLVGAGGYRVRRHGNADMFAVTQTMMMRIALVGVRRHLVAITVMVAERRCRRLRHRATLHALIGMRGRAQSQR